MQRLEVSGAVRPLYGSLGVKGLSHAVYISNLERPSAATVRSTLTRCVHLRHRFCIGQAAEQRRSHSVCLKHV